MTRIVLAYSESLVPASANAEGAADHDAIAWLAARYSADVVALTLDFGRGRELEALRDRALASGALRAHVLDVAGEFASDYLLPALRAGALATTVARTTGLGRLIIAQKLVEIAAIETTTFVSHGCPPPEERLATAVASLQPTMTVVPLPSSIVTAARLKSRAKTHPVRPFERAFVELSFVGGAPTAINGVPMPLVDLIGSLDMLLGTPRVGQLGLLDTPSAVVLHRAHDGLRAAATSDDRAGLVEQYSAFIESGAWFSPERRALDRTIEEIEKTVNGTVRLQLVNDVCDIVDVKRLETARVVKVQ